MGLQASIARWSAVATVGLGLGCVPVPEGPELAGFYPRVVELGEGLVRYEFGPGRLRTTNDRPWQGTSSYTYPPVLASNAGPLTVEVSGLDLSAIRYAGDLSWPPDRSDRGAWLEVGFAGASSLSYRLSSTLDGRKTLWDGRTLEGGFSRYRAYLFEGLRDGDPLGRHHFNAEAWGGTSNPEYDTFDLRLHYVEGMAPAWIRLHASDAWRGGNAQAGWPCPWNPARNTAAAGTADSVWAGACTPADGTTGETLGAWVAAGTPWAGPDLGLVRPRITITNWAHAYGGDEASWDNLVITGVPAAGSIVTVGSGRIHPTGTARTVAWTPQGEGAVFSFVCVTRSESGSGWLHYQTGQLDLVGVGSDWVLADSTSVAFGGTAIVNGQHGYRYEVWATHGASGDAAPSLSVQIGTVDGLPAYTAFGTLADGNITRHAR